MSTTGSRPSDRFFDAAYGGRAPWDIGAPQPALVALFNEYPPVGPALDLGCGTGDLVLALAERGLTGLGVDMAPAAIAQARAKAAQAAPEVVQRVEFRVGDALRPSLLPGPFGTVVDSGFFHLFGPTERELLAQELATALVPGGRYYLLGFAISSPLASAPKQVREDELRALFTPEKGWRILALRAAEFVLRSTRGNVPAVAACVERRLEWSPEQ